MPAVSFHESLRALTAKKPIPYQEICQLFQEHAKRIANRPATLSHMTFEVLEHLGVCQVISLLIPIQTVEDEYLEYLFLTRALGESNAEDLAKVLCQFAASRYAVFDSLTTKLSIFETVCLGYPDILANVQVSKEN